MQFQVSEGTNLFSDCAKQLKHQITFKGPNFERRQNDIEVTLASKWKHNHGSGCRT